MSLRETTAASFSAENKARVEKILAKYETKRSALLPVLYVAQDQFGYLTDGAMRLVAETVDVPPTFVYEAALFYSMYKKKDMGRYCVQVCNNITCGMMGSKELIDVAENELGIKLNGLTPDRMFSLIPVQCLGSCDTAPVVQINDDYHENLNPRSFRELLQKLKKAEGK